MAMQLSKGGDFYKATMEFVSGAKLYNSLILSMKKKFVLVSSS